MSSAPLASAWMAWQAHRSGRRPTDRGSQQGDDPAHKAVKERQYDMARDVEWSGAEQYGIPDEERPGVSHSHDDPDAQTCQ